MSIHGSAISPFPSPAKSSAFLPLLARRWSISLALSSGSAADRPSKSENSKNSKERKKTRKKPEDFYLGIAHLLCPLLCGPPLGLDLAHHHVWRRRRHRVHGHRGGRQELRRLRGQSDERCVVYSLLIILSAPWAQHLVIRPFLTQTNAGACVGPDARAYVMIDKGVF